MQTIKDFHLSVAHALFTVLRHRIMNAACNATAGRDYEQSRQIAACPLS
jgi:hypothetical protein